MKKRVRSIDNQFQLDPDSNPTNMLEPDFPVDIIPFDVK